MSNTGKSGQETNDLTGSGEHVSSVVQDDNVTSLLRQQGLPWYMKSDGYRPQSGQSLVDPINLWPDHNQGDRIEEQLMISPPERKNYDDALHCRDLGNGVYEVGVHIADVAYHVKPNTTDDFSAKQK